MPTAIPTPSPDWAATQTAKETAWQATQSARPTWTRIPTHSSAPPRTPNHDATHHAQINRWRLTETARPTHTPTPTYTPLPTATPDHTATHFAQRYAWISTQTARPTHTPTPTRTPNHDATRITQIQQRQLTETARPTPTLTPTITPTHPIIPTGIPINASILSRPTATPDDSGTIYAAVQPGDTAIGIAVQHRISLTHLLAQNNLDETGIIMPGERLVIHENTPPHHHESQPLLADILPYSNPDCTLSLETFEDTNSDKQRQPGEGIHHLLVIIQDTQSTWSVTRITTHGLLHLPVPCVPLQLEIPYLFERRVLTKTQVERQMTVQLIQPAPRLPRMLP